MNLILIKSSEVSEGKTVIFDTRKDARAKHTLSHLRKSAGDTLTVGIIGGCQGLATLSLVSLAQIQLTLEFDPRKPADNLNISEISLVLAVPFPKRVKYLWAVIASMGVTRIVVIRGLLSDPDFTQTSALTPQVYEALLEEGLSQGGHTRPVEVVIEVDEPVSRELLNNLGLARTTESNTAKVFFDCGDEEGIPPPAREVILEQLSKQDVSKTLSAIVAVGPERGWTDEEANLFHEAGFASATLGRSILRVDSAVIASLAIVTAALDEVQLKRNTISNKRTVDEFTGQA
jgi:16S rRNA U1498 N3-methylase RsmE